MAAAMLKFAAWTMVIVIVVFAAPVLGSSLGAAVASRGATVPSGCHGHDVPHSTPAHSCCQPANQETTISIAPAPLLRAEPPADAFALCFPLRQPAPDLVVAGVSPPRSSVLRV
jgi:hypothetical protein